MLNKIRQIVKNTTEELVSIPNTEVVELTGIGHVHVLNILNSRKRKRQYQRHLIWSHKWQWKPDTLTIFFDKDTTYGREYSISPPPKRTGGYEKNTCLIWNQKNIILPHGTFPSPSGNIHSCQFKRDSSK
jgi:hypothetical protein